MKTLYLEAFAGISGNMLLGALISLGVPFAYLKKELGKLNLGAYELVCENVQKVGIKATYFNVNLKTEEHHEHGENAHDHEHEHTHMHRHYADIVHILEHSEIDKNLQQRALAVFKNLALAESKVHGIPVEEVHFHEVGAIDTIIDIVGSLLALDYLKVEQILFSDITTGKGFVKCAHGLMPVPAPATAELLKTLVHHQGEIDRELTTPTGAALALSLGRQSVDMPQAFQGAQIGYGAGTWDLAIPNVLRATLGETTGTVNTVAEETLHVLSCNIDNMDAQIYPYVMDKALQVGALDAWVTPLIMKKGRPAQMLSVLTRAEHVATLKTLLFKETTTLGIRDAVVERTALARNFVPVATAWGKINIKEALLDGKVIKAAPEYEDCKAIAVKEDLPLQQVLQTAMLKYKEITHEK
jgi:uncharacterized protein (TIGR00299 family) protein